MDDMSNGLKSLDVPLLLTMVLSFEFGLKHEPLYSKEGFHQTMILLQESYGEAFSCRSWEG
jgi:hypothetical protein